MAPGRSHQGFSKCCILTMQDLLEQLRPQLKRFENFEDACKAVDEVEAQEAAQRAEGKQTPELSDSEDEALSESDKAGIIHFSLFQCHRMLMT